MPAEGGEAGRSGEIRTHDPQHPMLMRYQAALRSDRGSSADGIDNSDLSRWTQPATEEARPDAQLHADGILAAVAPFALFLVGRAIP